MDKSIVPVNQIAVRSSTCYEFSIPNEAKTVEIEDDDISVGTEKSQVEDLKLNHQFDEKHVPSVFQALIIKKMNMLKHFHLRIDDQSCTMMMSYEFLVRWEKKESGWMISYGNSEEAIKTDDPEKSTIDHLWFVLKNPDIKLELLLIGFFNDSESENSPKVDSEKLNTLLQWMLDSIDHQVQTCRFAYRGCSDTTFLSMLKHVEPGTLREIGCKISWEQGKDHGKLNEIVATDQWKQAERISSYGVIPLTLADVLHFDSILLTCASITPEDVLRVTEHIFNSANNKFCMLCCNDKSIDVDTIVDVLRSQIDESQFIRTKPVWDYNTFGYKIVKSMKCVFLEGDDNSVTVATYKFS